MGPYAEARGTMEGAIEKLGNEGLSVDELISKSVEEAKSQLGESAKQPWSSIANFYRRILLEWGALLDEDLKPIRPAFGSGLVRVKRLRENWTVSNDAAMLLVLIENKEDISDQDIKHLTRAIYHRSTSEDMSKIALAVTDLIRQERVEQFDREGLVILQKRKQPSSSENPQQIERGPIRVVK